MTANRSKLIFFVLLMLVSTTSAFAQTLATLPTTRAVLGSASITPETIPVAYLQLANGDALQRYEAKLHLMGLTREQLPTLLAAVRSNLPVTPTQALALRDVVLQAHVASERLEPDLSKDTNSNIAGPKGFLGLAPQIMNRPFIRDGERLAVNDGVQFESRTPGFCAYRWLQDGDVILAIGRDGDDQMLRVASFTVLSNAVRATAPGTTIQMKVLRGGGTVTLRFPLDARPAVATNPQDFLAAMRQFAEKAEAYWQANFSPLIDPDYS